MGTLKTERPSPYTYVKGITARRALHDAASSVGKFTGINVKDAKEALGAAIVVGAAANLIRSVEGQTISPPKIPSCYGGEENIICDGPFSFSSRDIEINGTIADASCDRYGNVWPGVSVPSGRSCAAYHNEADFRSNCSRVAQECSTPNESPAPETNPNSGSGSGSGDDNFSTSIPTPTPKPRVPECAQSQYNDFPVRCTDFKPPIRLFFTKAEQRGNQTRWPNCQEIACREADSSISSRYAGYIQTTGGNTWIKYDGRFCVSKVDVNSPPYTYHSRNILVTPVWDSEAAWRLNGTAGRLRGYVPSTGVAGLAPDDPTRAIPVKNGCPVYSQRFPDALLIDLPDLAEAGRALYNYGETDKLLARRNISFPDHDGNGNIWPGPTPTPNPTPTPTPSSASWSSTIAAGVTSAASTVGATLSALLTPTPTNVIATAAPKMTVSAMGIGMGLVGSGIILGVSLGIIYYVVYSSKDNRVQLQRTTPEFVLENSGITSEELQEFEAQALADIERQQNELPPPYEDPPPYEETPCNT